MNQARKLTGFALASATAALLLTGVSVTSVANAGQKAATVKCSGINSCKGKSACGTATTSCAGQNSCKGKGWIKTTAKVCKAKGGKIKK